MENAEIGTRLPGGGMLKLSPVTPDDREFLLRVYTSTRADELAQVPWTDEQKAGFCEWQFDLQRKDYDANFPEAQYSVILIDELPAGRIWINRGDKEIHLLDIAILQEFQNRGVGTTLLRQLIDEAASTNKALRHTVFVLNTDAKRFYERLGFVVFEEMGAYLQMEWRPKTT